MSSWLSTALRPDVVRRSVRVALVVGTLLVVINQGHVLLDGTATPGTFARILMTYLVPYAVSTWASVGAIRVAGGEESG